MANTIRAGFAGVDAVRRDLEAVAEGLGTFLRPVLRSAAQPVLDLTQGLTPVGPGPQSRTDRLPHVRETWRIGVQANGVNIYSLHPAAPLLEFGGTIAPKGHPITFAAHGMALTAGKQQQSAVEARVEAGIDALIQRHGL